MKKTVVGTTPGGRKRRALVAETQKGGGLSIWVGALGSVNGQKILFTDVQAAQLVRDLAALGYK